jgi:phosphohistidine phosphatase SixA
VSRRTLSGGGLLLALVLVPLVASPQRGGGQALKPQLGGAALVGALKRGGHVILLRHTSTEHVAPDPDIFDLRDCATQRNLSDHGRRQARRMREAIEKLGIQISEVLSSPYCRCLETGRLAFGKVTESELLSVADGLSVPEKSERGARVRALLATPPADGTNSVLIAHSGTLLYSFGLDTKPEGIAHVFRPGPTGTTTFYVGRLTPEDWPRLAGLEPAEP